VVGELGFIALTGRTGATVAEAVIDAAKIPLVTGRRWHRANGYAVCYTSSGQLRLHRVIMGVVDPEVLVDHIDGNRLICTMQNLRLVDRSGNAQNVDQGRGDMRNIYSRAPGRWTVAVHAAGASRHVGSFGDLDEAKRAAREARAKLLPFANEDRHR
jgi:hypothetical protein